MQECQHLASGVALHVPHHFQLRRIGLADRHFFAPMHQTDPLCNAGKEHRRLGSLLALPDHRNGFSLVHHGAAGRIVVNAASQHLVLSFYLELSRRRAGRQNDGGRLINLLCALHGLDRLHQLDAPHLLGHKLRAEALRTTLHFFTQAQPVDPGVKARIVFDVFTSDGLPADGLLFQHDCMKPCSGGIQCGRISRRAAADDHNVIHRSHTAHLHSAPAFSSRKRRSPSPKKGRSESLPPRR